jgi:hypothetical protein
MRTAVTLLILLASSTLGAQSASKALEYRVKAAFLLNFVKFVDWPEHSSEAPLEICVIGEDPFGANLDQVLEGEVVNGRKVIARRLPRVRSECSVVFFPEGEKIQETSPGVLTVGEGAGFLKAGGMIAFVIENRRVRFDVNQPAARNANLRLSSRLLSVARAVEK